VPAVFPNPIPLMATRPPGDDPRRFVDDVRIVDTAPVRNRRVEKVLLLGWLAIAAKCALVAWLVGKYQMPFSPLWVNAPTVFFGLACTALYYRRP
jgi:hypothetical protein